jgi:hypothetical protein
VEELVIVLLKLLVQLVLYAFTGKWHRLGNHDDQPAPPASPARPRPKRQAKGARKSIAGALADLRDPRAARDALRRALAERIEGMPAETQAPWLFEFPDEYVEPEPNHEVVGGEVPASQPIFQRPKQARRPPKPPSPGRPRSIANAVRDRQTVRKALVLGAALGPRGPRH